MGSARYRKKMLEKEIERIKREVRYLNGKVETGWAEFDAILKEKGAEGKSIIELFNETGLTSYLKRHDGLKELAEAFFTSTKKAEEAYTFDGPDDMTTPKRIVRELAKLILDWMVKIGEESWKPVSKELERLGYGEWTEKACLISASYILATDLFAERLESKALTKYQTKKEIVGLARDGINAYLKAHEEEMPEEPSSKLVSISDLFGDMELTRLGASMWEKTYKIGEGDNEVIALAKATAKNWGDECTSTGVDVTDGLMAVVEMVAAFSAKWAVHAFQRITTTHTYAAALMCSDIDADVLSSIEMQWGAFMVSIPDGLLKLDDVELGTVTEYNRILVASFKHQACMILLSQGASKSINRLAVTLDDNIVKVLEPRDVDLSNTIGNMEVSEPAYAKMKRVITMAQRLVGGLLLQLQSPNNFKSKTYPAKEPRNKRDPGEPAHRVVFVGAPLKIDCRVKVKDYIEHGSSKRKGGAPPAVQFVVRGHFTHQPYGPRNSLRKVIWLQPFWKGPKEAPIFTRPKKLGDKQ